MLTSRTTPHLTQNSQQGHTLSAIPQSGSCTGKVWPKEPLRLGRSGSESSCHSVRSPSRTRLRTPHFPPSLPTRLIGKLSSPGPNAISTFKSWFSKVRSSSIKPRTVFPLLSHPCTDIISGLRSCPIWLISSERHAATNTCGRSARLGRRGGRGCRGRDRWLVELRPAAPGRPGAYAGNGACQSTSLQCTSQRRKLTHADHGIRWPDLDRSSSRSYGEPAPS